MNDQQISTTLDVERTTRLRAFLTDEARHSTAVPLARTGNRPARKAFAPRRVAVGIGVAAVIGAGVFGVTAVTGGPGFPVRDAVAIETTDGWTTVRLTDHDADPDRVLAQLREAGVPARIEELRADENGLTILRVAGGSVASIHPRAAGAAGLVGLSVSSPSLAGILGPEGSRTIISFAPTDGDGSRLGAIDRSKGDPAFLFGPAGADGSAPASSGATGDPAARAAAEQFRLTTGLAMEQAGVRLAQDGSVSIHSGSDGQVVIYATS